MIQPIPFRPQRRLRLRFASGLGACLAAAALLAACGAGHTNTSPKSGAVGGPVSGPADTHCTLADGGTLVQSINPLSCSGTGPGPAAGGDTGMPATLYNSEGDDDDCKLHVSWNSSPIQENTDVTFTLLLTRLSDGTPLTGVPIHVEAILDDTHPGPNTTQTTMEMSSGDYMVGPVRFDRPGQWTVRFHFHEECSDALADSPHAHAAFFVDVP